MSITRPSNVPSTATMIGTGAPLPGGIVPGSPLDPQYLVVQQFAQTVNRMNLAASRFYLQAVTDWQTNKGIDEAYGLPVPPAPEQPKLRVANVVYAHPDGTTETVYGPGLLAYMWES